MTEVAKKKRDFKSLDLTNVVASQPTVPAPVEGLEPKEKVKEGVWIDGISNEDITPEAFRDWLSDLLPGMDMEKTALKSLSTPADREKLILRVVDLFKMTNLRTHVVKEKKFVN